MSHLNRNVGMQIWLFAISMLIHANQGTDQLSWQSLRPLRRDAQSCQTRQESWFRLSIRGGRKIEEPKSTKTVKVSKKSPRSKTRKSDSDVVVTKEDKVNTKRRKQDAECATEPKKKDSVKVSKKSPRFKARKSDSDVVVTKEDKVNTKRRKQDAECATEPKKKDSVKVSKESPRSKARKSDSDVVVTKEDKVNTKRRKQGEGANEEQTKKESKKSRKSLHQMMLHDWVMQQLALSHKVVSRDELMKNMTSAQQNKSGSSTRLQAEKVMTKADNSSTLTLFIGNLPKDVTSSDLRTLFSPCYPDSPVNIDFRIPYTKEGQGKGFAFVTMPDNETRLKFIEMSGTKFAGRKVCVKSSKKPSLCDTVFVSNFPEGFQDTQLREFFSTCGEIVEIRSSSSYTTNNGELSTGPTAEQPCWHFVKFKDEITAEKAIKMHGTVLEGRAIIVDYTESLRSTSDAGQGDHLNGIQPDEAVGDPAPAETDTLKVSNLDFGISEKELKKIFADCGEICGIDWGLDVKRGLFLGHAYIVFADPSGVASALAAPRTCTGRDVWMAPVESRRFLFSDEGGGSKEAMGRVGRLPPEDCKTVFAYNLPPGTEEEEIRSLLGGCGNILSVRVNQTAVSRTGVPSSFAHIDFETHEAAQRAIELRGQDVGGRSVGLTMSHAPTVVRSHKDSFFLAGEKPAGCRTIFMGNLPFNVNEGDVRSFLAECGPIESLRWGEQEGAFKGFVHVVFTHTEATDMAVEKSGSLLNGRRIKIDYGVEERRRKKEQVKPPVCRSIHVSNLHHGTSERLLRKHFEGCGDIERVELSHDKRTGEFRGYGFVRFEEEDAEEATEKALKMTGTMLLGKELVVRYSSRDWLEAPRVYKDEYSVSLSGLSSSMTKSAIEEVMGTYGSIEDLRWSSRRLERKGRDKDRAPPGFKGKVYIRFRKRKSAAAAIADGKVLIGEEEATIARAHDSQRDYMKKPPMAKTRLPHWHPQSIYSWKKRQRRKQEGASGRQERRS